MFFSAFLLRCFVFFNAFHNTRNEWKKNCLIKKLAASRNARSVRCDYLRVHAPVICTREQKKKNTPSFFETHIFPSFSMLRFPRNPFFFSSPPFLQPSDQLFQPFSPSKTVVAHPRAFLAVYVLVILLNSLFSCVKSVRNDFSHTRDSGGTFLKSRSPENREKKSKIRDIVRRTKKYVVGVSGCFVRRRRVDTIFIICPDIRSFHTDDNRRAHFRNLIFFFFTSAASRRIKHLVFEFRWPTTRRSAKTTRKRNLYAKQLLTPRLLFLPLSFVVFHGNFTAIYRDGARFFFKRKRF